MIERPEDKFIRRFGAWQCGDDDIQTYLDKEWSLGIACRSCPRCIEWTPDDLRARFGEKKFLRIADLVPKLACTGDEGCGSRDVAVFPWRPEMARGKGPA